MIPPADSGERAAWVARPEVALGGGPGTFYSRVAPFHPSERYPEAPFPDSAPAGENPAYDAVRRCLRLLRLDEAGYGGERWNPLGGLIRPGDKVVLKPNAVLDRHPDALDPFAIITHPSVVRAVADYVFIALQGKGEIVIADAPQVDCDFENYLKVTQLPAIAEFYAARADFKLSILDLRRLRGRSADGRGIASARFLSRGDGDPLGYRVVDLGGRSAFASLSHCERIYAADYDRKEASRHHLQGRHEYCIAGSVLAADVFISLPKLKTHGKVGVTLNLKGLVGINGDKNYVPHFRVGGPESGGDEFPAGLAPMRRGSRRAQRWMIDHLLARRRAGLEPLYLGMTAGKRRLARLLRGTGVLADGDNAKAVISTGDWQGNDTAWRMTRDLALILYYAGSDGRICDHVQRKVFCLVDGIIAGEGDGPLHPAPRPSGVVVAGFSPVRVDLACAHLMGFDPGRFPQLSAWIGQGDPSLSVPSLDDVKVATEPAPDALPLADLPRLIPRFLPPAGW